MLKKYVSPIELGHFRFALIAPVIQGTFVEPSAAAYYRRITAKPLTLPTGEQVIYQPGTLVYDTLKLPVNGTTVP